MGSQRVRVFQIFQERNTLLLIPEIPKEIQRYEISLFFFSNYKNPLSGTNIKPTLAGFFLEQAEKLRIKQHMSAFVRISSVIFALRLMLLLQDRMQRYGRT